METGRYLHLVPNPSCPICSQRSSLEGPQSHSAEPASPPVWGRATTHNSQQVHWTTFRARLWFKCCLGLVVPNSFPGPTPFLDGQKGWSGERCRIGPGPRTRCHRCCRGPQRRRSWHRLALEVLHLMANLCHCGSMSKGCLKICLIKSPIINCGSLSPRKQQLRQTLCYLPAPASALADGREHDQLDNFF